MITNKISGENRKFLFISLLFFLFFAFSSHVDAATQAPQFSLPSAIDGSPIDMKNYDGKVVLINFFTTWCPPCRQEIPSLNKLQDQNGAKGFSVIGISLDESTSRIVVKFMKKMKINYPVAMADDNVTRDFGGVIGIPTSILRIQDEEYGMPYHQVLRFHNSTNLSSSKDDKCG